jgi:hypothetical protein
MGWAVLYIAFGAVAIWLLAEVLLQYKARLRWRLLAFAGFATVVLGVVALSSVVVITLGAVAFAVGQTFVTLSYRRGFSTGWALGGMPGSSRRRRDGGDGLQGDEADPVLEVSGVEEERPGGGHGEAEYVQDPYDTSAYDPPAYHPQPMPDDTGEYGIYDRDDDRSVFAPAAHADPAGDSYGGLGGEEAYGYDHGREDQHQYAAYSDPYIGYDAGQYPGTGYDGLAAGGYGEQQDYGNQSYAGQDYGGQVYGGQSYGGQPGYGDGGYGASRSDSYGGAWVPQQRESGQQPVPEQSYPYQDPYGAGGYGGGYGDDGLGTGYGYGYSYPETGYPAEDGYGDGRNAGQGYDPATGGYQYDEQRGY